MALWKAASEYLGPFIVQKAIIYWLLQSQSQRCNHSRPINTYLNVCDGPVLKFSQIEKPKLNPTTT